MMFLSLSSARIIADTTSSILHYTDGLGTDIALDISALSVGQYDILYFNGALSAAPFLSGSPKRVGAINVRVAGKLTCHCSVGPSRAWDVWNIEGAQREITLLASSPGTEICTANTPFHPVNSDPTNSAAIIVGSPTDIDCEYEQAINTLVRNGVGSAWGEVAIGWNSTVSPVSGTPGEFGLDYSASGANGPGATVTGIHTQTAFQGVATIYALSGVPTILGVGSQVTFFGGNTPFNRVLKVKFLG